MKLEFKANSGKNTSFLSTCVSNGVNFKAKCKHCKNPMSGSKKATLTFVTPKVLYTFSEAVYVSLNFTETVLRSIPASGPTERILSIGGKIFRLDHCSLSYKTFENFMFIKINAPMQLIIYNTKLY